jgi:hypothetical protein
MESESLMVSRETISAHLAHPTVALEVLPWFLGREPEPASGGFSLATYDGPALPEAAPEVALAA